MKTNLIALTGLARSGKNTAADLIQELCPDLDVRQDAFARDLKYDVHERLCVPRDLDKELVRPLYQAYGAFWRSVDIDHWVKPVAERYHSWSRMDAVPQTSMGNLIDDGRRVVDNGGMFHPIPSLTIVTDLRYPNEAEWVKSQGGIVIRIVREGIECGEHESESGQSAITVDYEVQNNYGLMGLRLSLVKILEQLT